jgi:hypothetical protein
VQINWEEEIHQIFARRLSCPRCQADVEEMVVGYSRRPELSPFAPRHQNCPRGDACEARKLTTLCTDCARIERLRGTPADAGQLLETYMLDCRRDLEDSLDYLAEYWRDEFDLDEENFDRRLEEVDPDAYREEAEWRGRLEEEYLRYHLEFRNLHRRIPAAGWRAEYVEEIRALGYETSLGD